MRPGESRTGNTGRPRERRRVVEQYVKAAVEVVMRDMASKVDEIVEKPYADLTHEEKEFLYNVAQWIKIGLHSGDHNQHNHGLHALEENRGGQYDLARAFEFGHFMNAGSDTWIGRHFRSGGATTGSLDDLNGEALYNLVRGQNERAADPDSEYSGLDGFFGLFQSVGGTNKHGQSM